MVFCSAQNHDILVIRLKMRATLAGYFWPGWHRPSAAMRARARAARGSARGRVCVALRQGPAPPGLARPGWKVNTHSQLQVRIPENSQRAVRIRVLSK